jgi:hypothetical protein
VTKNKHKSDVCCEGHKQKEEKEEEEEEEGYRLQVKRSENTIKYRPFTITSEINNFLKFLLILGGLSELASEVVI